MKGDSIIDLSHESLMRIWDRLKLWVEEESIAVQMYMRLSEAAALYQAGKTGLWRPPDLQLALNWRKEKQPTLTWAQRYEPAFERTMVYLETSEKEFIAEEQNKIRLQKRALRRSRIFAIVLGSAAIISLGFMVWAIMMQIDATKQKENAERNLNRALESEELALERKAEAWEQFGEAAQLNLVLEALKIVAEHGADALGNIEFDSVVAIDSGDSEGKSGAVSRMMTAAPGALLAADERPQTGGTKSSGDVQTMSEFLHLASATSEFEDQPLGRLPDLVKVLVLPRFHVAGVDLYAVDAQFECAREKPEDIHAARRGTPTVLPEVQMIAETVQSDSHSYWRSYDTRGLFVQLDRSVSSWRTFVV